MGLHALDVAPTPGRVATNRQTLVDHAHAVRDDVYLVDRDNAHEVTRCQVLGKQSRSPGDVDLARLDQAERRGAQPRQHGRLINTKMPDHDAILRVHNRTDLLGRGGARGRQVLRQ
jgi:hypothetical protein